ncbi:hypothetical protein [Streptomyces sp. NPDC047028]
MSSAPRGPATQRTTLITGATQGMGRALALDLAPRGGTLLLLDRTGG